MTPFRLKNWTQWDELKEYIRRLEGAITQQKESNMLSIHKKNVNSKKSSLKNENFCEKNRELRPVRDVATCPDLLAAFHLKKLIDPTENLNYLL